MLFLAVVFSTMPLSCRSDVSATSVSRSSDDRKSLAEFQQDYGEKRWLYQIKTRGRGQGSMRFVSPQVAPVVSELSDLLLEFKVGSGGIEVGGAVEVWFPAGVDAPQLSDPGSPGYIEIDTGSNLSQSIDYIQYYRGGPRPRAIGQRKRVLVLKVTQQALAAGEIILIRINRLRTPRFARRLSDGDLPFRTYVDHNADGFSEMISRNPQIDLLPGPPKSLHVATQGQAKPGEPVKISVSVFDSWKNPVLDFGGRLRVESTDVAATAPREIVMQREDRGRMQFEATFETEGFQWMTVSTVGSTPKDKLVTGVSNPIEVRSELRRPPVWFGDLHVHTENSIDAISGAHAVSEYGDSYQMGRDYLGLDFMANSDHQNHYRHEEWQAMIETSNENNVPGEFVTLLAYERSAVRGDRNVYFPGDDAPYIPYDGKGDPETLFEYLSDNHIDAITVPHHIAQSMRPSDLDLHDSRFDSVVEIFSNHGRSEYPDNKPGFSHHEKAAVKGHTLLDSLTKGQRMGVIASGDDHWAMPGRNGLAAIFAPELTREAIYSSMKSRMTYATASNRALLWFTIDGVPMGGEVEASSSPVIRVSAAASQLITKVEVLRDGTVVKKEDPEGRVAEMQWTDSGFDKSSWYYVRLTLESDPNSIGQFRKGREYLPEFVWSSPIWVKKASGRARE